MATISLLVLCLLVAGTGHFLWPGPVALVYVAVSVVLVLLSGPRKVWQWFLQLGKDVGQVVRTGRRALRRPWVLILALVSLLELAWRIVLAFVLPPLGADALTYHLTTVAWWVQRGGFFPNPFSDISEGYPANTELVFTHIALFSHDAQIVDVAQMAFALSGALATVGIARVLGASRVPSVVAGILFFLTPIVLAQATVAYVDIATVSLFATCLYFMARYLESFPAIPDTHQHRSTRLLLLSGLAGGLCLGSKPQAPIWIASVCVFLAVGLVQAARRRQTTPSRALGAFGTFVGVTLVLGSYWYVRDWIDHHDPVYPATITLLGKTLFRGNTDALIESGSSKFPISVIKSWAHELAPFLRSESFYRYDQRAGGFGPVWIYVLLPLLLVFAFVALRRRDRIALYVLGITGLAWLVSPYQWWSRFTLELVVTAAAATAVCLTWWAARRAGTVLAWFMTLLVLLGVGLSTWKYELGDGRTIDTPAVLRLVGASGEARTLNIGGSNVADLVPTGDLIAVDPNKVTLVFPIWGTHFQHRLVAVDLAGRGSWSRVKASGANYLFVTPKGRGVATNSLPRNKLVAEQGGFALYKVN